MLAGLGKVDLKANKIEMESAVFLISYVAIFIVTYKIIVSISRYYKTQIPIWKHIKNKPPTSTPWHILNVFFFFLFFIPVANLNGYEKMTDGELVLHHKQQLAKIKYHLILLVLILIALVFPKK
ncbi:MAG: hypothetical protein HY015_02070 [Bacteroidetes bacterium]|nr:hypothetical protein [Bacteroidota bacterium]MBI3481759.1 hypothetical protein [Bacteroidota bacterium]